MENDVAATNRRTEASTPLPTAKSVALNAKAMAFLLAPCILFLWAAGYAVIYGTDYANTPQEKEVVERHRKDAEIRKIVAASIAAGKEFPRRETMLEELDARDERTKAMEETAAACGWSRRIGYAVLVGVVLQVYLTLRLRAHYKKLAAGATVSS
jgi:Flp pilus assembly protein TadB